MKAKYGDHTVDFTYPPVLYATLKEDGTIDQQHAHPFTGYTHEGWRGTFWNPDPMGGEVLRDSVVLLQRSYWLPVPVGCPPGAGLNDDWLTRYREQRQKYIRQSTGPGWLLYMAMGERTASLFRDHFMNGEGRHLGLSWGHDFMTAIHQGSLDGMQFEGCVIRVLEYAHPDTLLCLPNDPARRD